MEKRELSAPQVKFVESQVFNTPPGSPLKSLQPHPPPPGSTSSHTPSLSHGDPNEMSFQSNSFATTLPPPQSTEPLISGVEPLSTSANGGGKRGSDAMQNLAMDAVVEANLGDLEELRNDIEGSSVYSIRADALKKWSEKIALSLGMIRDALSKKGADIGAPSAASSRMLQAQSIAKSMRKSGGKGGSDKSHADLRHAHSTITGSSLDRGEKTQAVLTIGGSVAAAIYVLVEACATAVQAEWATCFVYQAKTEELVLCCGVGKRLGKAGSQRIPANVGVESHVMNTGIAINIAHAYVEDEFSANMDRQTNTRTKTQLVFPLLKPGTTSVAFGVVEFGNKTTAKNGHGFSPEDETRVGQCAQLVSLIMSKYPSDLTNGNCFDPAIFPKETPSGPSFVAGLAIPNGPLEPTLVHRTARVGHLKRSEVMRDAVGLSSAPTITEVISHVTRINDAWKHAVMLNMELEREIDRLQEALRVSRRETSRLQTQLVDLKEKYETLEKEFKAGGLMRTNSRLGGAAKRNSAASPNGRSSRLQ